MWSRGRRLSVRLAELGIATAGDLADPDAQKRAAIQCGAGVTTRELCVIACLELDGAMPPTQEAC